MSIRTGLLTITACVSLTHYGYSQVSTVNQPVPQTPSEVARLLLKQGTLIQLPPQGRVKQKIKKGAPTFAMPGGRSSVLLIQLPQYQTPYVLTITSHRRGIGRTTEIFVPSGIYLDANLQELGGFGEDRLVGQVEKYAAEFAFGENTKTRYLLLFTRGALVGQGMGMRGDLGLVKSGIFRLERSLEGDIQIEIKRTGVKSR